MSYDPWDTQERRHRSDRHHESRRERQNYVEEEAIESRGGLRPSRHTALIPRREDSVEEVEREFPPGAGYGQRRPTGRRARSADRGRYDDDDGYYGRRGSRRQDERRSKTGVNSVMGDTDKHQVNIVATIHRAPARKAHHHATVANHWVSKRWPL